MANEILKQATYIRYVIANLPKFAQISTLTSAESFLQRILWKLKRAWTSFHATFFVEFFNKINHFLLLHKLAKFHYQTTFTSQVIQQYVFHVSCLGIWCRHDIWISKMLKVHYLKNEKSFRSEIKSIFPCFASALL